MISVLIIILVIIAILIFILACIMLIPFHIIINLGNQGIEVKGYFKVKWMNIKLIKRDIPSEEGKKEEKKEEVEKKPKSKWDLDRIVKVFNLFLEALPHFEKIIFALIRSVKLERFWLDLKFGLDSPVDTAQLTGILWSVGSIVNILPRISINMSPEFMKPTFEANLDLELKLKLIWIVFEALRAFTKKPVRSLISEIRS